jgi:hypothetical protein
MPWSLAKIFMLLVGFVVSEKNVSISSDSRGSARMRTLTGEDTSPCGTRDIWVTPVTHSRKDAFRLQLDDADWFRPLSDPRVERRAYISTKRAGFDIVQMTRARQ